jgi:hypothetical protein
MSPGPKIRNIMVANNSITITVSSIFNPAFSISNKLILTKFINKIGFQSTTYILVGI